MSLRDLTAWNSCGCLDHIANRGKGKQKCWGLNMELFMPESSRAVEEALWHLDALNRN